MRTIFFIIAMTLSFALIACTDEDRPIKNIPQAVINSFSKQFNGAYPVDWDKEGRYYVADFLYPYDSSLAKYETEVWYEPNGIWKMTVVDVSFYQLPQSVQVSFTASEYGGWRVDDIDIVERNGKGVIYLLEVESGNAEKELHYNGSGDLLEVKGHSTENFADLL